MKIPQPTGEAPEEETQADAVCAKFQNALVHEMLKIKGAADAVLAHHVEEAQRKASCKAQVVRQRKVAEERAERRRADRRHALLALYLASFAKEAHELLRLDQALSSPALATLERAPASATSAARLAARLAAVVQPLLHRLLHLLGRAERERGRRPNRRHWHARALSRRRGGCR